MSFFQSLFGNNFSGRAQRNDVATGMQAAGGELEGGYGQARREMQAGADQATGYFTPWAERGARGQTLYEDSLGLNGEPGGQHARTAYEAGRNPYLEFEQDRAQQGLDRAANARGSLNSGGNALAVARARQQLGYQDYGNWQRQVAGLGQQGMAADQARANIAMQNGQNLGNLRYGLAQQKAGVGISGTNALTAGRNTGNQNALNILGVANQAFQPPGQDGKGGGAGSNMLSGAGSWIGALGALFA